MCEQAIVVEALTRDLVKFQYMRIMIGSSQLNALMQVDIAQPY